MKKKILFMSLFLILVLSGYFIKQEFPTKFGNETLTLYGNVDIRDVNLGFRVFGRIAQLNFEEGDRVKKGDVLAVLDKVPFEEEVALTKAQLAQAKANLMNVEKLYERALKLVRVGAVSQADLDNALSARDQALASVDVAKAAVEKALTSYQDTEIRAPNDGIILTRAREVGAVVASNNTVYSLMLGRPVWIRTYVDEPALGFIYPGQKAIVTTDSGGKYEGQIGYISPQAEFTPKNVETQQLRTNLVYRLRVIIDNADEGLRQGMPVTVRVKKEKPK